jgi:hypothetical protein
MAGPTLAPPLTIPHWYPFQKSTAIRGAILQSPGNWDAVRLADPGGDFGFGRSREEWIARATASPNLRQRAAVITALLQRLGARRVVSAGVGVGLLEYLIASSMPGLSWRCGDYASVSLELLRTRFLECPTIEPMDLRTPTWVGDPDEVVLLNRVDTELNDVEWMHTFAELAKRGARSIIWVPGGLLSWKLLADQLYAVVYAIRFRYPLTRAGYLRTDRRMRQLFGAGYERVEVALADLPVWRLKRRA